MQARPAIIQETVFDDINNEPAVQFVVYDECGQLWGVYEKEAPYFSRDCLKLIKSEVTLRTAQVLKFTAQEFGILNREFGGWL